MPNFIFIHLEVATIWPHALDLTYQWRDCVHEWIDDQTYAQTHTKGSEITELFVKSLNEG